MHDIGIRDPANGHWKADIEQFALHITAYGTGKQSKGINKPYHFLSEIPNLRFSLVNLWFGSVKVTFSTSNLTIPPAHPMPLVKRKFYLLNTKKQVTIYQSILSPLELYKEADREGIFKFYLMEFNIILQNCMHVSFH